MYYDKERDEFSKALALVAEIGGDTNTVLLGGIVSALYDIANELHELNEPIKETRNGFEESIANGWIYG